MTAYPTMHRLMVDVLDVQRPEGSITRAAGYDLEGNLVWFWGPTQKMKVLAAALRVFGAVTVEVAGWQVEHVRLLEEAA